MHQTEMPHDVSDRIRRISAKYDSRVSIVLTRQSKEIGIVGNEHALLAPREFKMCFVGRSKKANVGRGRDIDSTIAKTARDGMIDVLIEMKSNHWPAPQPSIDLQFLFVQMRPGIG